MVTSRERIPSVSSP